MPPAFAFAKQIICLQLGRLLQALYIERHQCLLSTQKYVKSRVIELDHDKLWNMQDKAEFYGEVVTLVIDGKEEKVKVQAVQRHAFKPKLTHIDFVRA